MDDALKNIVFVDFNETYWSQRVKGNTTTIHPHQVNKYSKYT